MNGRFASHDDLTRRELVARGAALLALAGGASALSGCGSKGRMPDTLLTNEIANPRAADSLRGWRATVGGATARGELKLAPGAGGAQLDFELPAKGGGAVMPAAGEPVPVDPGQVVWGQAAAMVGVAPGVGGQLTLEVIFVDARGRARDPQVLQRVTDWGPRHPVPLQGFQPAPPGVAACHLAVRVQGDARTRARLRVTDALIAVDPAVVPQYFDGDTPGARWTGAPGESPSDGRVPERVTPADPGFRLGFNDNAVPESHLPPNDDVALNRALGSRVLRITVNLADPSFQRHAGASIDWEAPYPASYDRLYRDCRREGIQMLPLALFCPPWMGVAQGEPPPVTHREEWAGLVAQLARRWPNAAGIEVWNEPNLGPFFWRPRADPEAYAKLLAATYDRIKASHPRMRVLTGGLSGTPSSVGGDLAFGEFLQRMFDAGAAGKFDVMSFHAYPFDGGSLHFHEALRVARDALAAAGRRVPLWITETGTSTGTEAAAGLTSVTERQQAIINRLLLGLGKRQADVAVLCFHTILSLTRLAPTAFETGYEFVQRSGKRKPVFAAIAAEMGAPGLPAGRPSWPSSVR